MDHLSSGDLLRDEVASGSALGQSCLKTMSEGKLLPSSTIMAMLKKNMAGNPGHYVALDGFPRSAENCRDFEDIMGAPECAFYIDVPDDVMIERILKRGEESGRADDNIDTAKERLKTFHSQGKVVLDYLKNSGVPVHTLDGTQTPENVWLQLIKCNTPLTKRIVTNRD
jgi:adenylate kinase family enzyme